MGSNAARQLRENPILNVVGAVTLCGVACGAIVHFFGSEVDEKQAGKRERAQVESEVERFVRETRSDVEKLDTRLGRVETRLDEADARSNLQSLVESLDQKISERFDLVERGLGEIDKRLERIEDDELPPPALVDDVELPDAKVLKSNSGKSPGATRAIKKAETDPLVEEDKGN